MNSQLADALLGKLYCVPVAIDGWRQWKLRQIALLYSFG